MSAMLPLIWISSRVSSRASRSGLVPLEGLYQEGEEPRRAAICIGPEYDAVGFDLVRRAVKEASFYDVLIVCGFAFAPEVDDTRLNFPLPVLKAHMNQDLRMGDKLKATGTGNLFVVLGEPDIAIHEADGGMLQFEIRGMDIFDPTTGQVRSSGATISRQTSPLGSLTTTTTRKASSCARPTSWARTPTKACTARSGPRSTRRPGPRSTPQSRASELPDW
jgi:hypothetical protein